MPPPAEPRTILSRVAAQEACLDTWTSFMPYLANSPFSLAMIRGAASVSAMKPSLAVVTSGVSAAETLTAGVALEAGLEAGLEAVSVEFEDVQPWASKVPAAVTPAVQMNFRLENCVILVHQYSSDKLSKIRSGFGSFLYQQLSSP